MDIQVFETDLIKDVNSSINPEGIANHRGSTFGANQSEQINPTKF